MKTSVALCTYNGDRYLKEQLDSILNQTILVDEIIACDDNSTDETVIILEKYKSLHPNLIKIHQNKENLKSVKNFEKAISLCSNEIIFLSDQDDIWENEKVEKIINCFNQNPKINVIATNGCYYNGHQKDCSKISVWDIPNLLKQENRKINYFEIISSITNIATGATMAMKKEYVKQIFPFPVYQDFHHDEWIALNASFENYFLFLDQKLLFYRIHEDQQVGENFFKLQKKDISAFTSLYRDSDFHEYKIILKKISYNYTRKRNLLDNCTFNERARKLLENAMEVDKQTYFEIKKKMRILHPFNYFTLYIFDKISKKRKLN